MFDSKKIDDITEKLMAALPPGLKTLKEDLGKNFRSVLQTALNKMDLVTREEFDVQVAVLQKTRQKLEALEQKIAALEQNKKTKAE